MFLKIRPCILTALIVATLPVWISPVKAGDLPDDEGSLKDTGYYAPTPLWTGFYVGVHGGYAWGDMSVVDTDGGVPYGAFEYSPDGGFGGATVGYNLQIDELVLGLEGDVGYMDLSGSKVIASSDPNHHQDLTLDGGLYAVLGGRLGLALGNTLLYGKGGWAYFDGEANQATTKPWYKATSTGSFSGWAYGGGIEHAVGNGWSIKAEYLHFNFGSEGGVQEKVVSSLPDADDGTPVGYKFHNEHDLDVDTFRVGLNYKIGGDRHPIEPLK